MSYLTWYALLESLKENLRLMERRKVPTERMRFAALGQLRYGIGSLGLEAVKAVSNRRHPTRPAAL
jgi:hypothetical protein